MGGTLPRTSSARTLQLREPFLSPSSRSASRPASSVVWVPPVVGYYREGVCALCLCLCCFQELDKIKNAFTDFLPFDSRGVFSLGSTPGTDAEGTMGSNLVLALPSKKEPLPSSALSRKLSGAFCASPRFPVRSC